MTIAIDTQARNTKSNSEVGGIRLLSPLLCLPAMASLDGSRRRGNELWIARRTAEVLGHELSVRSIVGRGSLFRLVVPLGRARKP